MYACEVWMRLRVYMSVQVLCGDEANALQGLSERMAKVKRFLWALNFKEIRFSQLSLVKN